MDKQTEHCSSPLEQGIIIKYVLAFIKNLFKNIW